MAAQIISLVTTGGEAPYTYSVLHNSLTTLPMLGYPQPGVSGLATVIFSTIDQTITVDTTYLEAGTYKLNIQITDHAARTSTKVLTIKVLSATKFTILNESTSVIPGSFPYEGNIDLLSSGNKGTVVWSLIHAQTTLPGATITEDIYGNKVLAYIISQYGSFTIGLQAEDDYKTVTRILNLKVLAPSAYKLVDGQIEALFTDAGYTEGIHSFSATVADSNGTPSTSTRAFSFSLRPPISTINIPNSLVKYWYVQDPTEIYFPITGTLSGLSVQDSSGTFSNGISYNIEGSAKRIKFSGPPTLARNAELSVPINLQFSNTTVASVSKTFTIPAYDGNYDESVITGICYTKPIVSGEFFALNPQKAFFNSPSIERHNWIARLQYNSSLPQGLSLDANTGLIYGRALATAPSTSVIEFIDPLTNLLTGSIEIHFDIVSCDFSLVESLPSGTVSFDYTGSIFTTTTHDLAEVVVYSGTLPYGLALSTAKVLSTGSLTFSNTAKTIVRTSGSWIVDGLTIGNRLTLSGFATTANNIDVTIASVTNASTIVVNETITNASESGVTTSYNTPILTGNPLGAGHFDLWIKATDVFGGIGLLYKRLEIFYSTPLAIITTSLPALTNRPYSTPLSAVGGQGSLTWTLDSSSPALPTGITLSTLGVLAGTYAGSSYAANIVVAVVDSKGATAKATLTLTFSNTLSVSTNSVPSIIRGESFSFNLNAYGGTESYTWTVSSGVLPTGISLSTDGTLSGFVSTGTSYSPTAVTFTVTDSGAAVATKALTIKVVDKASTLAIDASGVGPISKGGNYQGVMRVVVGASTAVAPFSWEIAPGSPNQLPAGLHLYSKDNGQIVYITGRCTLALTNYSVKIRVIDAFGLWATTYVLLSSVSSVRIDTRVIAQGKVGDSYLQTLQGGSWNLPLTWSVDPTTPLPSGLSMTSSGEISGNPSSYFSGNIMFKLTDSLSDLVTQPVLLEIKNSDLILSTASIPQLQTSNEWAFQLAATGGSGVYSWSISPNSTHQLPINVQLDSATGLLHTTGTIDIGIKSIVFRVTDNTGTTTDKTLSMSVIYLQAVTPGPDYYNGTTHGYLGYVRQDGGGALTSQIIPRSSRSFYAILTNFSSQSINQVTLTTTGDITAVVESMTPTEILINITKVPAQILGDNEFTLYILDNGVSVPVTLKYKVVSGKNLSVTLLDGTAIPVIGISTESLA